MRYGSVERNRALGYAIAASVVLHALVLSAEWPQLSDALKQPVEALTPIIARLVEPAPPAPPPPAPAPPPAPVPEAKPKPKPEPARKAKVVQREKPIVTPTPAPAPVPAPAPAPAPAEPSAPVAKAAPSPSPVPAPPAPAGPSVPDTASLVEQYRSALLAEARRHKAYPTAAVDNGWEGEVLVRMAIGADGAIAALEVRSSSGYPLLDRQAVEMFRRAKPHVALPQALRGKPFAVELRAVFNLKDQASG